MFLLIDTVYVQIFEGYNFYGLSKSKIFVILVSGIICYQPFSSICIVIVLKKIEDLIFVNDKLLWKKQKLRPSILPIFHYFTLTC